MDASSDELRSDTVADNSSNELRSNTAQDQDFHQTRWIAQRGRQQPPNPNPKPNWSSTAS